jgi:alpha-glucuronidase
VGMRILDMVKAAIYTLNLQLMVLVKRHNSILKDILEGKIQGKRSRGRQRLKWTDNINRWTGETLAVNTIKSRNRVEWRPMVANLRCGDGTE